MEYKVLPLDKIVPRQPPSRNWNHETFGPRLGELIHTFCCDVNFEIFEEYRDIILNVYNNQDKSQQDQQGLYKIQKFFNLKEDFYKHKKFYNPLVATPYGDKYLVHPGRDRYLILKALGYSEYEFLICTEEEMMPDNFETLKSHHVDGTLFRWNKRNFSTVTNVDSTAFENWI